MRVFKDGLMHNRHMKMWLSACPTAIYILKGKRQPAAIIQLVAYLSVYSGVVNSDPSSAT